LPLGARTCSSMPEEGRTRNGSKSSSLLLAKAHQAREAARISRTLARSVQQQQKELSAGDAPGVARPPSELCAEGDKAFFGHGAAQSYDTAFKCYMKAAQGRYAPAMSRLAACFQHGRGVARSEADALYWFRKAAKDNEADALNGLGCLYESGAWAECGRDYERAREYYQRAADQGHLDAQTNLGYVHEKGLGTEVDFMSAAEWYKRAAARGYGKAQNNLGTLYYTGRGVDKSVEKAVEWYRKAAAQGNASALNNLGLCYEDGLGAPKDEAEAARLYKRAGDLGNVQALNNYAYMSMVAEDYAEARTYFRKAVELGSADAAHNLATMLENGLGQRSKDLLGAEELYATAAASGHAQAGESLERVRQHIAELDELGVFADPDELADRLRRAVELGAGSSSHQTQMEELQAQLEQSERECMRLRAQLKHAKTGSELESALSIRSGAAGDKPTKKLKWNMISAASVRLTASIKATALAAAVKDAAAKNALSPGAGKAGRPGLKREPSIPRSGGASTPVRKSALSSQMNALIKEHNKEVTRLVAAHASVQNELDVSNKTREALDDVVKNLFVRTLRLEGQLKAHGVTPVIPAETSLTVVNGCPVDHVLDSGEIELSHGIFRPMTSTAGAAASTSRAPAPSSEALELERIALGDEDEDEDEDEEDDEEEDEDDELPMRVQASPVKKKALPPPPLQLPASKSAPDAGASSSGGGGGGGGDKWRGAGGGVGSNTLAHGYRQAAAEADYDSSDSDDALPIRGRR